MTNNMNNLEKEAEKYADKMDRSENGLVEQCFIAGAKSKYVEIEKLKSLIQENESILKMLERHGGEERIMFPLYVRIKDLENQIKELENG